jgi:C1A family cysteine protease
MTHVGKFGKHYGWLQSNRSGQLRLRGMVSGWQPSAELLAKVANETKASLNLADSPFMPPVYDQQQIGSCVDNAYAAKGEFARAKLGLPGGWVPSRLMLYYDVRAAEGTLPYDDGSTVGDCIMCANFYGFAPEADWPYVPTPADPNSGAFPQGSPPVVHPPSKAYVDGRMHLPVTPLRVQHNLMHLKACVEDGWMIQFGFTVYDSIYDQNGEPVKDLPMPKRGDQIDGGHSVNIVFWDNTHRNADGSLGAFFVRNSWGPSVQVSGYFWIPYAYMMSSLCSDFWTLRKVIT